MVQKLLHILEMYDLKNVEVNTKYNLNLLKKMYNLNSVIIIFFLM